MKRFINLLVTVAMILSLCACGVGKLYKSGDVIETDLFKVVPKFTGYANKLRNWPDENFMTPSNRESETKDTPYKAGEGKVEMYGEIEVEYIGAEKSNTTLEIGIVANYDNGYEYKTDDVGNSANKDDWDYDSTMVFEPLSDNNKRIMRYCIEVPAEVEQNTDKPLTVTFTINGKAYNYDFRATEVLGSDYDPRDELYGEIDSELKIQVKTALTKNTIKEYGYYDTTFGEYTIKFSDSKVTAVLPINSSYQYNFEGTYEIYSKSILINWSHGEQGHLDYKFENGVFEVLDFGMER